MSDINKELEQLKAQLAAAEADKAKLEADKAALQNLVDTAPSIVKPIEGTFSANVMVDGKPVKKKFGFADGQRLIRFSDGNVVPTEVVIRLAEGGKATPDELTEYPTLRDLTTTDRTDNGTCKSELQRLVDIGFGLLKPA